MTNYLLSLPPYKSTTIISKHNLTESVNLNTQFMNNQAAFKPSKAVAKCWIIIRELAGSNSVIFTMWNAL